MPKIRKETSNRRGTNDRAKLRKKIKEGRRKNKRDAKKNTQWKSKTKKDPGIPSEFPYKDQILAEVAEQRRLAAEEKEKKKLEKQRALAKARAIANGEPFEDSDAEENAEGAEDDNETLNASKDLNVGAESIASLSAKFLTTELKPRPRPVTEVEEEDDEEEDDVPVLINRDLPNLKSVLEKADVVLEVVDGRDPLAFRSKSIEQLATDMGKKVLLVLNKIDTCPREAIASWSQQLRTQRPTLLFRAASSFLPEASIVLSQPVVKKGKGKAKIPTNDAVGADSLLATLSQWSKENKKDKHLVVAVVGVTNVGKSSLINSLLQRSALPIYTLASSSRGPTTTVLPQEVTLDIDHQTITLIDTPGLSFVSEKNADDESIAEASRARDILIRSKGRIDRLKDATPPIAHIVSRANTEDLMLMYNLAAFTKGDPTAFLSGVARANQLLKKKGELDLTGAARIVLRDWSVGKILHYTTPPTTTPVPAESSSKQQPAHEAFIAQLYEKDESILASIPTRKERRKAGGLIKMSAGVLEERPVAVDEDWAGVETSEDEESDDDEHAEVDAEGMDVDEEEEEEEDEDEEDEEEENKEEDEEEENKEEDEEEEETPPPPPISNKQKRKRALEAPVPERPSKKVAFAAKPSKQSRSKQPDTQKGKHTPNPATQKPLKSAQAPSKESSSVSEEKPVSKGKAPSKVKANTSMLALKSAVKTPLEKKSRVANVTSKKAQAPATTSKKGDAGPEAYDFGKFF